MTVLAFEFESGTTGDAEMYTWSEMPTPLWQIASGVLVLLSRRFWINGCIGRWFMTEPISRSIVMETKALRAVLLPCRDFAIWRSPVTPAPF